MNPLVELQEAVVASILGNPQLSCVPCSSFRKLNTESVQNEAAAAWKIRVDGKVGLASLVLMPSLQVLDPDVPGPQYTVSLVVRVFHDDHVNNTGMGCEDVAMKILSWLDGMVYEGLTELHGADKADALKPNYDYPGMLVYDLTLTGPFPQDYDGRTVPPDIQADDQGNVTLTCADPEAEVWFTTDGTNPMPPANPNEATTSTLYTASFAVPSGVVVQALAWNRTLMPSSTARGTITTTE